MHSATVVRRRGRAPVRQVFTDRDEGDLAVDPPSPALDRRRSVVAPLPWTWLRQVHGHRVVEVRRPGECAGEEADAAVTAVPGATLAVHTADCAGVLLWGDGDGVTVVGAAHAGWRGTCSGVLQSTVAAMRDLGAEQVHWRLGPCIAAARYEFGPDDIDVVADRLGDGVRALTATGRPALDLRAAVAAALDEAGALAGTPVDDVVCTAASPELYSWRAGRDRARQAAVTWIEPHGVTT